MTFAQRMKMDVFKLIDVGGCTLSKLETVAHKISHVACRSKLKLSMEEAGARLGSYPAGIEYYLCDSCKFVHAGHPAAWVDRAKTIIVKKQEAKQRNPRTKTPAWKLDPRMLAA